MAINAQNYVIKTNSPNVPRISLNLAIATQSDVASAIEVYDEQVLEYENAFNEIVVNRDYVADRLMKDICAGSGVPNLTDGGIDYVNNTISLHVKADDVFTTAVNGRSLGSVATITSVESSVQSLYDTFYVEGTSSVLANGSDYYVEGTYDTKAYTTADAVGEISSGSVFINAIPNATGTSKVFENKDANGDTQYVISYAKAYEVSSGVSGAWVVQGAVESAAVIAYSVNADITSDVSWVTP